MFTKIDEGVLNYRLLGLILIKYTNWLPNDKISPTFAPKKLLVQK